MRNDYYSNSKDYINRWVVSYADLVTMLLALFMVLFAVSQNVTKYQAKMIAEHHLDISKNLAAEQVEQLEELKVLFSENIEQNKKTSILLIFMCLSDSYRASIILLYKSILFVC